MDMEISEELRQQKASIIQKVLDSIKQVKELEDGYGLKFNSSNEDLNLIYQWIFVERMISPFLRFLLKIESHQGPLWLDISGPDGTKPLLKGDLALNRWL